MSTRNSGPFLEQFFIPDKRIERIAEERLTSLALMPASPGPVAVERYCDKRWGFPEDYVDLPKGVLGEAVFSENGLECIHVSRALDDSSPIGLIRTRSTIAHEIGHGELHEEKFIAKLIHDHAQGDLFLKPTASSASVNRVVTVCRENQIFGNNKDEWWEIQANKFMAALLMPPSLLHQVFDEWNTEFPPEDWPPIYSLEYVIADTFKVSQQMANIAAKRLWERQAKEVGSGKIAATKAI
jgi:Zn-dependent peptidase ImmA (M78 family)